ncbi:hypothetical protein MFMK1_003417 [Metallumcola ferriviriculae]|uniref:DUF2127 domain-containing protein n=1 Tax=Metallumcola ferriviriculae TaxID=3039180 RepID=A0AAU0USG2_9FIRM|nr:hypothetical protein MFMK1_003417 [Desulfitibacteraceae bacterium MK1]
MTAKREAKIIFKLEQRHEFVRGTWAGIIGAIAKYIFNELMQVLNIAKYDNNATAITVVMKGYEHNLAFWLFGFLAAMIIGAFFGVIIAFMYSYIFTEESYLFKAAGLGVAIWLFNFGLISKAFHYPADIKWSMGDVLSMLVSLIIYSMITAYSLKQMGFFRDPSTDEEYF